MTRRPTLYAELVIPNPPAAPQAACDWCGDRHSSARCPWIKAIDYYEDGTVRRIEFVAGSMP